MTDKNLTLPKPEEIAMVAEVADSSLSLDRTRKFRSYSRAGIPVYWIVNLVERQIEVYSIPKSPRKGSPYYDRRLDFRVGQEVPLVIAGERIGSIAVDAILPPG